MVRTGHPKSSSGLHVGTGTWPLPHICPQISHIPHTKIVKQTNKLMERQENSKSKPNKQIVREYRWAF